MTKSSPIEELEKTLGYEKWMLRKAVEVYKSSIGYVYPRKTIVKDDNSVNIEFKLGDRFDIGKSQELICEFSPLLFVSGFKILDMLMEWIIKGTQGDCPWHFEKKKKILKNNKISLLLPLKNG